MFKPGVRSQGTRPWVTTRQKAATPASRCDPHGTHEYVCAPLGVLDEPGGNVAVAGAAALQTTSIGLHTVLEALQHTL